MPLIPVTVDADVVIDHTLYGFDRALSTAELPGHFLIEQLWLHPNLPDSNLYEPKRILLQGFGAGPMVGEDAREHTDAVLVARLGLTHIMMETPVCMIPIGQPAHLLAAQLLTEEIEREHGVLTLEYRGPVPWSWVLSYSVEFYRLEH